MKVRWSNRANTDFNNILEFLFKNWSIKEVENFINKTDEVILKIQHNPELFIKSAKRPNVHKGFVTKQISLFYKVNRKKQEITLLSFWDNRQNPKKLHY